MSKIPYVNMKVHEDFKRKMKVKASEQNKSIIGLSKEMAKEEDFDKEFKKKFKGSDLFRL